MKSKWIAVMAGVIFVLLGISLAAPRFIDKEKSSEALPVESAVLTRAASEPVTQSEPVQTGAAEKESSRPVSEVSTEKKEVQTKSAPPVTRASAETTTKKTETTTVAGQAEWQNAKYYVERLGRVLTLPESAAVLRYTYDAAKDFYYTGFTVPAGTLYYTYKNTIAPLTERYADSLDVRFDYDGRAWLVHLVKGQYAWIYVGGEAEVYCSKKASTRELGNSNALYTIPAEEDCPDISLIMEWIPQKSEPVTFSHSQERTWICDGYVFGTLSDSTSPLNELSMNSRLVFPNAEMAALFAEGLEELGLHEAKSSAGLPADYYYRNEKTVWVNWQTASGVTTVANTANNSEKDK